MNPLSQLKDIHQPPPISGWPLAPGWYMLLVLILAILLIYLYIHFKKRLLTKLALHQLHQLQQNKKHKTPQQVISELSVLLRRAALIQYSRHEIAQLYGKTWLAFLDSATKTTAFTQGKGHVLAYAPYQKSPELPDELFDLAKQFIKKLRKK